MSSNVLFCPINSIKPKYIHLTIILKREKQPQRLEQENNLSFCLKK